MLRRTACWLSSLVLVLWVVPGSCEYPAEPSGGPTPDALSTMLFFPCPTGDWFDCETAEQEIRDMIAEAINGYWGNPHNLDACDRARTEILNAINNRPFYLFGSHFLDDGGEHVLGSVVTKSSGTHLGFRASLFTFLG